MCLCLDRAAQRFYFDEDSLEGKRRVLSTFFVSITVVAFIVLLFSSIIYLLIDDDIIGHFKIYFYAVIISLLNSFSLIALSFYRLTENSTKYVILKLLRFALNTFFIISILICVENTGFGKIIADILTISILVPIYILIIYDKVGFKFDYNLFIKGLKYSFPFIPTLIFAWVITLSNRFFLEYYYNLEMVGQFGMSFKISSAIFIICSAITTAYTPTFYKKAKQNSKSDIFLNNQISYIYIFLSFALALFVPEIVLYFLSSQYSGIEIPIFLLILSNLLNSIMGITTVLYILQSKNTLYNLYCGIGAAILSLILNFILIPKYGLLGAALTSIFSSSFLYFLQLFFSRKGFHLENNTFFKFILISFFVVVIYIFNKFKIDFLITSLKFLFFCLLLYIIYSLHKKYDFYTSTYA